MTSKRIMLPIVAAILLPCPTAPALAAPGDQLVTEKLADPDPGFVPPPPEKKHATAKKKSSDDDSSLDKAFENLGRVTARLSQMAPQYKPTEAEMQAARERFRQQLQNRASSSQDD
jgi:hypothetical protein